MNLPFGSPVLDTAARLMAPFILLFGAYVVAHGHHGPGGGFQGGVILAAALVLVRLVRGGRTGFAPGPAVWLCVASAGLMLYIGIGLASLLFGGGFLDYGALPLGLEPAAARAAGSLGIELGVALGVMGVVLLIFEVLTAPERA